MNTKKKSFNWAELFSRFGVVAIFALALLAASIASDRFFTVVNLLSVFVQCSIVGVLACGMTMLIVSGNTDLSAGSGVALGGVVCGVIMKANGNWLLAVLATFAVLLFTCYLQSLLVAYVGLMPFIVTLAGQLALRGAAYVVSKGAPIIGIGSMRIYQVKVPGSILMADSAYGNYGSTIMVFDELYFVRPLYLRDRR